MRNWEAADTARSLRAPVASDDKYRRGVVGLVTGSADYPGAAVLGVEAAWRTGIGMVRYLGPARAEQLVLGARPETVIGEGRVQAWVVGSGTDAATRSDADAAVVRRLLEGTAPTLLDAGALDLAPGAVCPIIVTPHAREHARLRRALGLAPLPDDAADDLRAAACAQTAAVLGGVVVLKGATTFVSDPTGTVRAVDAGTPWLATAGTGDVLAGAIGAVVAARAARETMNLVDLADAAASGVYLHGRAGRIAAAAVHPDGGPIAAMDVALALPRAVADILAG